MKKMPLLKNRRDPFLYRPGVGIVLVNEERMVFLGMRYDSLRNNENQIAWQMPQGGIDEGEDPRDAALRELEEETGVPSHTVTILSETEEWLYYDLPPFLQKKLWGGKYLGQRQKWFLMRLEGPDSFINIHHTAHPEFSAWRWATPEEAQAQIVIFKQELYLDIFTAFKNLL